jgi:hypothetical protein
MLCPWWSRRLFKLALEGLIRRCTPSRLPTRQARPSPQTQHTRAFSSPPTISKEPSPPIRLMGSGWDSPCTHVATSESTERSWFTTVTTSRALARLRGGLSLRPARVHTAAHSPGTRAFARPGLHRGLRLRRRGGQRRVVPRVACRPSAGARAAGLKA